MNTIPLRAYNREIEEALEQKQYEEAIAHCRQILKVFPKHIDTYRLLGKAHLESQRYGNAADIFQRILSSLPDDFVSHVGMSIIREDEGNLDAAIWHMERSFETQPYNTAIQGELRRLYGQRDGMEPPKIRMTRGALARMYAKSDLYDQAISEINSNLVEDPQRADLEVLLAQMYANNGQQTEAIQVYSSLLKRLPYCIEANRYLSKVFSDNDQVDDLKTYRQRLEALDPYEAHISPKMPTANDVPDQAVIINRLDWDGGVMSAEETEQPEWATSIGVNLDEGDGEEEELPDWLHDSTEESPESFDPMKEPQQSIPSWMEEAGWGPSQGEFDESQSFLDEAESNGREHAVTSEIPSWLQDIAPEKMVSEDQDFSFDSEPNETDLPSWLSDEADGASDTIINWLDDKAKETYQDHIDEEPLTLPDQNDLSETEPTLETPKATETSEELETQDWDQDFDAETPSPRQDEIPDWLLDLEASAVEEEELVEVAFSDQAETATTDEPDEIPAWLSGSIDELAISNQNVPAITMDETESPELPSWLQGFEEDAPETVPPVIDSVETSFSEAEDMSGEEPTDIPDWLQEMQVKTLEPDGMSAVVAGEDVAEPETEGGADWLLDTDAEIAALGIHSAIAAESLADEESSKIYDQDGETDEEIEPEMMETVTLEDLTEEEPVEIPEWLRDMEAESPTPEPLEQFSGTGMEPLGILATDELDEALIESKPDAIPDWLIGLAEQKEDDEIQTLEKQPEIAAEIEPAILPDWLQDITKDEPESTIPSGVTGWLKNIDEDELNRMVIEYEPGELPEWLENMVKERNETTEIVYSKEEDETGVDYPASEELPDMDLEMVQDEPTSISAAEVELPDWLMDLDKTIESETDQVQASGTEFQPPSGEEMLEEDQEQVFDFEDADAAMAWLEGLAAKQGVSEEELLTRPEERLESPPEWVQAEIDAATETSDTELSEPLSVIEQLKPEQYADTEEIGEIETIEAISEATAEFPDQSDDLDESPGPEPGHMETLPEWVLEAEEIQTEESQPDFEDAETAMAWLEDLATKQGVSEEELLTKPEDRPAEPPEQAMEEMVDQTAPEVPDWLKETLDGETLLDETALKAQAEEEIQEEIPDWLKAIYQSESAMQEEEVSQETQEAPSFDTESRIEDLEGIPATIQETPGIDDIQADHTEDQRDDAMGAESIPDMVSEAELPAIESEFTTPEKTDLIPEPEVMETTDERVLEVFETTSEETDLEPSVEEETLEPVEKTEIEPPDWVLSGEEPAEDYEWLPSEIEEEVTAADAIVDLNEASMIQLERLSPLGFRKAQAIVAYRNENGPFEDIADLLFIPGIDQDIIDQLKSRLIVKPHSIAETPSQAEIETSIIPEDDLHALQLAARAEMRSGKIEPAIEKYEQLIQQGQRLDEVMADLGAAITEGLISDKMVDTLTNLGDAFLKTNQLQAALDAYTKAERLLG